MADVRQSVTSFFHIDWKSPQTRILIGLMAPSILVGMDHSMFGVVLPAIREVFKLDPDFAAWTSMIYTLPFMALMPLYGRLGDHIGKRRLLLFGNVLFLLGTLMVMTAQSLSWFMVGRFIQGVGSAGFVPLSIAIISQRFVPNERGKALGTWNSAIPLSGLVVPNLAGVLVDWMGWRAVYPVTFIVGILSLYIIRTNIQALTRRIDLQFLRSFDWIGVLLLSGGLSTLFLYTSSRPITGFPALTDWRLLAGWVLLFVLLYFWEQSRSQPYVRFAVFRNAMFTVASFNALMRMFLMSSINFVLPLYLSDIHNSSYNIIGLMLALQAGALFATSQLGGRLADRWGSRRPAALSMIGLIGVMAVLALLPASAPVWVILLSTTAHGLLVGLSLAPLHRAAMHGVEDNELGMAAGLYSMLRFAGQILGYASAGVLLQSGLERLAAPVQAYQIVFWLFAAAAVIGTVLAMQLRES